jgi:hypothetical protein
VLGTGPKRVSAQLFAGELLLCRSAAARAAIFQGCSGAVAGLLNAEGRGFAQNTPAQLMWVGLLLRAAAQWPARGALALRARADARVNVLRPEPAAGDPNGFTAPVGTLGADIGLDLLWRLL